MYHDGHDTSIGLRTIESPAPPRHGMRIFYLFLALVAGGLFLLTLGLAMDPQAGATELVSRGHVVEDGSDSLTNTITLDASVVAIVAGFVIPFLTSLITNYSANKRLKAFINLIFAAAVATFNEIIVVGEGTFELKSAVVYFFLSIGATIGSYQTVIKPNDLAYKMAPHTGLGVKRP